MLKQALLVIGIAGASVTGLSGAFAAEFGTSEEALAMLNRAVSEVNTDKFAAIDKFNYNRPGFRDRDLFVFCFDGSNGKFTAHEAMVGQDVRTLHDTTGAPFGEQMYENAKLGQIAMVAYISPVPGSNAHVSKRAYVTRIGDYVCGVSYYLFNAPSARPTN